MDMQQAQLEASECECATIRERAETLQAAKQKAETLLKEYIDR